MEAKSLSRESLVKMRKIFDEDTEARMDMATFLKRFGAGGGQKIGDGRDVSNAETGA